MRKHAPIEQLRESAKEARAILASRKIILPDDQSAISRIFKENKVTLPGVPAYIPYVWTIEGARRILCDISDMWFEDKEDADKENINKYFKFVWETIRQQKKLINKKIKMTVKKKRYDTSFLSQRETADGIGRMIADSFAIAIGVKSIQSVSEYITWFIDWTDQLLLIWQQTNPTQ